MNDNNITSSLLFIYTETSLHAGTGSTVSVVDLPIQRERSTNYPVVQGSGVKGALRAQSTASNGDVEAIFGPETKNADKHAGALSVGDARVLLFPVRSLAGVFAYVTCPAVLARLYRDLGDTLPIPAGIAENTALVTSSSKVIAGGKVVLEEYSFAPQPNADVTEIAKWLAANALPQGDEYAYWRWKLDNDLVILPDDAFRDFVTNSTEIVTRVRLEPGKKTVAQGALWTQESLPSDVLLFSTVVARASRRDGDPHTAADMLQKMQETTPARIQLGGDETTGQGFVALKWQ